MTKFYCGGVEISRDEAKQIEEQNNELLESGELAKWAKVKFVMEVETENP